MINQIKQDFFYSDFDNREYFESIYILKKINKGIVRFLEAKLFKMTYKNFKIKILKHKITPNLDISDNSTFFLNTLSCFDIDCYFFIFTSFSFINQLGQVLFGNTNDVLYNQNNVFTSSKLYILNQLMNIFHDFYNSIFPNWIILRKRYYTYKKKIDYKCLEIKAVNSYLQTEFLCEYKSLKGNFIIKIPDLMSLIIKSKYENSYRAHKKKSSSFDTNYEISKYIYYTKLNCTIQLDPVFVSSNYILNLQVGDILNINKPDIITVYTENQIPVLSGKCYTDNLQKLILRVEKNFINLNSNFKKEKNE